MAFHLAGKDPATHEFTALDISAPRNSASTSTSSTTSTSDILDEAECLREQSEEDIFAGFEEATESDVRTRAPPQKRPRHSTQDLFLPSSPESSSGMVLTPFFGNAPQPKSILQIIDIHLAIDGNVGKQHLIYNFLLNSLIPVNKFNLNYFNLHET